MKTKMCKRTNCKLFHLTGTIKDEPTNTPKMENNSTTRAGMSTVSNDNNATTSFDTQELVFQVAKQPWATERMAKQMEK